MGEGRGTRGVGSAQRGGDSIERSSEAGQQAPAQAAAPGPLNRIMKLTAEAPAKKKTMPLRAKDTVPSTAPAPVDRTACSNTP